MAAEIERLNRQPAHEIAMVGRKCEQAFSKRFRLRSHAEFQRVFQRRCSVADTVLIVYGLQNKLGHSRLGLAVSKKVGGAVVRNQWKRLIREAFRQQRTHLPSDIDFVVLPRVGMQPDWNRVHTSFLQLAHRIKKRLDFEANQS